MAFQVSPGVNVSEIDLSTVVPATSSTEGAIAGVFRWGPVGERVLVTSEVELARRFGKPVVNFNEETFFTAADFLAYSDALYVVRVSDGSKASGAADTAVEDFSAKYPGAMGNAISIQIIDAAHWAVDDLGFDYAPEDGNFHIVVADDINGTISGVKGTSEQTTVLERFENVSLVAGSRNDQGNNNYIMDVIENSSSYLSLSDTGNIATMSEPATLTGGSDGSSEDAIALGDVQQGYDLFKNPEEVDVSLIMQGKARGEAGTAYTGLGNYITDIADSRKDCVAFVSPARELVVGIADTNTILTNLTGPTAASVSTSGTRSTYAVYDTGYKYRYDKYNDRYINTPLNGDIAGMCVRTDDQRDPWFSPAGYSRGIVKNIVKLTYNPPLAHRDALYKKGLNPVVTQPGQGTVLFGDKTFANKASAFDRINVRRLFIVLEKSIATASKAMLFEFNDEFTRAQFRNMVEPFLRDVQGRRGIYDFKVVADESNNTPEVIDTNRFVGDIYIKPARSINFIQLNFVAVRTGVEFSEIVGQ